MNLFKYLPRLNDARNEVVFYVMALATGLNELIELLQGADFTTLDGVQVALSALLALFARWQVYAKDTVERIRRGIDRDGV